MKHLLAVVVLLAAAGIARADDSTVATSTAPVAVVQSPINKPVLWVDTPYFKGNIPFANVDVVSLFDFIHMQPLVGAETPVMAITRLQFTAGAVTSVSGKGSPIFGAHLSLPNPTPNLVFLNDLKIGGFGGRNFNEGWWMAGLKIGKEIW